MQILEMLPNESAGDFAYRTLYFNIISVELVPGTMISPAEVAKELKISRTPIQAAFNKLANDGLLTIYPQRGSYVSQIDFQRVYESVYLRNLMDQAAIYKLAAPQLDLDEILFQLDTILRQQQLSVKKNNISQFFELDDNFHNLIYDAAKMSHIKTVVSSIAKDQTRLRYLKLQSNIRPQETLDEHQSILTALTDNNFMLAAKKSFEHLSKFAADITAVYQQTPEFFINWDGDPAEKFRLKEQTYFDMEG